MEPFKNSKSAEASRRTTDKEVLLKKEQEAADEMEAAIGSLSHLLDTQGDALSNRGYPTAYRCTDELKDLLKDSEGVVRKSCGELRNLYRQQQPVSA